MPLLRQCWAVVCVVVGVLVVGCTEKLSVAPSCTVTGQGGSLSLRTGEVVQAAAAAACVGLDAPRLVWTSSAPTIAAVDSQSGKVAGVSPGTATVSARVSGAAGALDIPVVVMECVPGGGISLNPPSITLPIGATFTTRPSIVLNACSRPATFTYASEDSTIARVDSLGTVTAVRYGQTLVRIRVPQNPALEARLIVTVTAPSTLGLSVSPIRIAFGVGDTMRIRAGATVPPGAPVGSDTTVLFRSENVCVATVTDAGLVTGRAIGATSVTVMARRDTGIRAIVGVTVGAPAVLRMTLQSFATGSPPQSADLSAVRGTLSVTVNIDSTLVPLGGRLDLSLGGRLAATSIVQAPATSGIFATTLSFATDARDATGARLYANGTNLLVATLTPTVAPAGNCPAVGGSHSVSAALNLVNP